MLALTIVAQPNAAKLKFTLHPPQFRIGDRLDHPPEGAVDTAETAANGFAPAKTVIAQYVARLEAMRPMIVVVNQVAISVIADKKVSHLQISTIGSRTSR
jgi:hypothetical protein